jgi:hypothetical protein
MSLDTHTEHNPNALWNQIEVNKPENCRGPENLTEAYEGYVMYLSN